MPTEPTVIRARLKLWALLGLLVGLWALSAPVRLLLASPPLEKPALLPDPPDGCSWWHPNETFPWQREVEREACAFSPLLEAPSARMVELYAPAGGRPSSQEDVDLPPGWEGITDPSDRRFLASVLPPWSSATYSTRPSRVKWVSTQRYLALRAQAWEAEVARRKAEVLALNRERYLQWKQEMAAQAGWRSALLPSTGELALLALALVLAGVGWRVAWRRKAVVLDEVGVRLAGRQLPWSAIEEMDWYPERVEVRLFDGTRQICDDLALPEEQVRPMELLTARLRAGQG